MICFVDGQPIGHIYFDRDEDLWWFMLNTDRHARAAIYNTETAARTALEKAYRKMNINDAFRTWFRTIDPETVTLAMKKRSI